MSSNGELLSLSHHQLLSVFGLDAPPTFFKRGPTGKPTNGAISVDGKFPGIVPSGVVRIPPLESRRSIISFSPTESLRIATVGCGHRPLSRPPSVIYAMLPSNPPGIYLGATKAVGEFLIWLIISR